MPKPSKKVLAYCAGVIDGRAVIGIHDGRLPYIALRMAGGLPRVFQKQFGGGLVREKNLNRTQWRVYGKLALRILGWLKPYLIHRRRDAGRLLKAYGRGVPF